MNITFLGGGNMAAALIGGLLERGFAATDLCVIELNEASRAALGARFGITTCPDPDPGALACDVLVLAVKPQQMRTALAPLAGRLDRQLVISVAAGLRLGDLARWLGGHPRLVRAMPNTPALIGAGIAGLFAAPAVDDAGRAMAERILGAVGKTLWVDEEAQIDAVTAISGSGPAYLFHFIEALEAAAMALGLEPGAARLLALETTLGSARLAADAGETPATLRQRVTSPGGTTEAALASLAQSGWFDAMTQAARAACERGRTLGASLGQDEPPLR